MFKVFGVHFILSRVGGDANRAACRGRWAHRPHGAEQCDDLKCIQVFCHLSGMAFNFLSTLLMSIVMV